MEEEEFEFLDSQRVSPTDFELIEAERIRNIDGQEIVVHEDYFVNDAKTTSTEDSSMSEDDFVPVRRSKRNKKSKTKSKKGLQALSDVKCKIPPKVKNRTSSTTTKIVKNKPLYSQILQGVAAKNNENEEAKKSEEAKCNTEESNAKTKEIVECEAQVEAEVEAEAEAEPEDSEIEVMECDVRKTSVDELLARGELKEPSVEEETSVQNTVPVDEPIVFEGVDTCEDANVWKFTSLFGFSSQLFEKDAFTPQDDKKISQDENEDGEGEEEEEEEDDEDENVEEQTVVEEEVTTSSIVCDSRFTKSLDDYGLKALFEERLVCEETNSLIAIKTSTLMLAILCSVVFGIFFGNCLVSIFMPVTYSGISVHTKNSLDTVEADDKFIMVKVDPAPPLFNYSSIWFGQPNEENLRSIFNEFRRLQRDHIRLQEAHNELRENIQLEKQMKWYWRKQARKDVVSLNSVKYTLHDGLMKVSDTKPPVEECKAKQPIKKKESYDHTINNLTESLKNAQKSSNYWREMYNDMKVSSVANASKHSPGYISLSQRMQLITKALKNLKMSSHAFNLSKAEKNSVDHVRGAWGRLKTQWKQKRAAATAAKETARTNVNRFRKMFSMSNVVNSPSAQNKIKMAASLKNGKTSEEDSGYASGAGGEEEDEKVSKGNIECKRVKAMNTNGDESEGLEGISCKSVPQNVSDCHHYSYTREEGKEEEEDDVTQGEYVSIFIHSYGQGANHSACYSPQYHTYPFISEEHKQLKWFKNKYEELLLLSEISKWRSRYELKKSMEKGRRDVAQVSLEKAKEVENLQVQKQFVEWELATVKQRLFDEKGKLHGEKEKFEKLLGNLDRILKTNEESMELWKKYETQKTQNRVEKLVKKVKRRERSKAKKKVDEAKKVLKTYIEGELKRIDERRRVENRNEELKKKLRAKVKYYKSMYDQSVEERTELRNFFNEAKTEAIVQKTFINNLLTKIKDLKYYKNVYERTVAETEEIRDSFKEVKTEAGIQRTIIKNLLTKIKNYRKKMRDNENEKRESEKVVRSYMDARTDVLTTSHVHGDGNAEVSETKPHNEIVHRHLSVRYPEEKIYKPRCQKHESDDVTKLVVDMDMDNSTFHMRNVFGSNIAVFYMNSFNEQTDVAPTMSDCVPHNPTPPQRLEMPLEPVPPHSMPPMSFFASLRHKYNNNDEEEEEEQSSPVPPTQTRRKPNIFIGPTFPPAPYIDPSIILRKLKATKSVREMNDAFDTEYDEEVTGPSLPRSFINMPPTTTPKRNKGATEKSRPKTEMIYLSEGGVDMVFTTTEDENGYVVSGKVVGKREE